MLGTFSCTWSSVCLLVSLRVPHGSLATGPRGQREPSSEQVSDSCEHDRKNFLDSGSGNSVCWIRRASLYSSSQWGRVDKLTRERIHLICICVLNWGQTNFKDQHSKTRACGKKEGFRYRVMHCLQGALCKVIFQIRERGSGMVNCHLRCKVLQQLLNRNVHLGK